MRVDINPQMSGTVGHTRSQEEIAKIHEMLKRRNAKLDPNPDRLQTV